MILDTEKHGELWTKLTEFLRTPHIGMRNLQNHFLSQHLSLGKHSTKAPIDAIVSTSL